jgi:hypothetical protein
MTAKPNAQLLRDHRARKKAEGMKRLVMWVPADKLAECKAAVARMCDPEAAAKAMVQKMVDMGWDEHVARGTVAAMATESVGYQRVRSVEAIIEGDAHGT